MCVHRAPAGGCYFCGGDVLVVYTHGALAESFCSGGQRAAYSTTSRVCATLCGRHGLRTTRAALTRQCLNIFIFYDLYGILELNSAIAKVKILKIFEQNRGSLLDFRGYIDLLGMNKNSKGLSL